MTRTPLRGLSLIDVLVGSALFLVIFLALIGLARSSLLLASLAKAKAGATAVANTQVEYIRSLPYDSTGTVGGIPAGDVAQNSTTTVNGLSYGVRTFIQYVDDPADGEGGADSNGITTDYKRIKVSVTYTLKGVLRRVDVVSTYAPPGIETTAGGGTLKVTVVDAGGAPVSGASVRVVNDSTAPTIDLTTFSDTSGIVLLGGAPTSTEYQVYVSKSGYSSAQTYERDGTNQNPTPGYLTIVENQTTAGTFAIDLLGSVTLATYRPLVASSTVDSFADSSLIASQSGIAVTGGQAQLAGDGAGGYVLSGSLTMVNVTPQNLVSWTVASTTLSAPAGTAVVVHVVDGSGTLIPDAVLPGNSAGFSGTEIDLSTIATSTYPTLALRADLSGDAITTPSLSLWAIHALVGPIPVPNVSFTLTGAKTIGSTGAAVPIVKTTLNSSTGASGSVTESLEWDSYALTLNDYDVIDACGAPPYAISPGVSYAHSLYLGDLTTHAVLVSVRDTSGAFVSGASVTLSRTGFSETVTTSSCGTAYFGALSPSSAYTIEISKTGYTTTTNTPVDVSGHLFYATSFP